MVVQVFVEVLMKYVLNGEDVNITHFTNYAIKMITSVFSDANYLKYLNGDRFGLAIGVFGLSFNEFVKQITKIYGDNNVQDVKENDNNDGDNAEDVKENINDNDIVADNENKNDDDDDKKEEKEIKEDEKDDGVELLVHTYPEYGVECKMYAFVSIAIHAINFWNNFYGYFNFTHVCECFWCTNDYEEYAFNWEENGLNITQKYGALVKQLCKSNAAWCGPAIIRAFRGVTMKINNDINHLKIDKKKKENIIDIIDNNKLTNETVIVSFLTYLYRLLKYGETNKAQQIVARAIKEFDEKEFDYGVFQTIIGDLHQLLKKIKHERKNKNKDNNNNNNDNNNNNNDNNNNNK